MSVDIVAFSSAVVNVPDDAGARPGTGTGT